MSKRYTSVVKLKWPALVAMLALVVGGMSAPAVAVITPEASAAQEAQMDASKAKKRCPSKVKNKSGKVKKKSWKVKSKKWQRKNNNSNVKITCAKWGGTNLTIKFKVRSKSSGLNGLATLHKGNKVAGHTWHEKGGAVTAPHKKGKYRLKVSVSGQKTLKSQKFSVPKPLASTDALTWVVGMGDSYMSGEGASFAGYGPRNGLKDLSGNWWINAYGGSLQKTYPGDFKRPIDQVGYPKRDSNRDLPANGKLCHRSGSASMYWNTPAFAAVNLACSGALSRTTPGKPGIDFDGGQATELQTFAEALPKGDSIKYIQVSIGGNDIGFDKIVTECVTDYLTSLIKKSCAKDTGSKLNQVIDNNAQEANDAVVRSGNNIIKAMSDAGFDPSTYTIVVTSYPIGVPSKENFEPAFNGKTFTLWPRQRIGGCGLTDSDLDMIKNTMGPILRNATVKGASRLANLNTTANIRVINATDAAKDHELCGKNVVSKNSQGQVTSTTYPKIGTPGKNSGTTAKTGPAWSGQSMNGKDGGWISPVIVCLQLPLMIKWTCDPTTQYPTLMKTLTCLQTATSPSGNDCDSTPSKNAQGTPLHPNYWLQRALATCHATSKSTAKNVITACTPNPNKKVDSFGRPQMSLVDNTKCSLLTLDNILVTDLSKACYTKSPDPT
jgi:hypothetical protein